jgi:hypothetical protein
MGTSAAVTLPEGQHRWYVQASDFYGNWRNSNEHYFEVNLAPSAPSMAGHGAILNHNRPTYSWTASTTGTGSILYKIYVDGLQRGEVDNQTSWLSRETLTDGAHSARVEACNNLNRCTSSQTVNFTVDTTPPSIPVQVTPVNRGYVGGGLVLYWNAASDPRGIGKYVLHVLRTDLTTFDQYEVGGSTLAFAVPGNRPEGEFSWFISACDVGGWCSPRASTTFRVELTPPTGLSPVSPASGSYSSDITPLFSWTAATDSGAGLSHYVLTVINGGTPYTYTVPAGTTRFELPLSGALECGTTALRHAWRVAAYDVVGNSVTTSNVFFYCRQPKPKDPIYTLSQ